MKRKLSQVACRWPVSAHTHTHVRMQTEARVTSIECSINVYYFWLCTAGVVSLTASMWSGRTPAVRRQHPQSLAWKDVKCPRALCTTHSNSTRCKYAHTKTHARTLRRHSAHDNNHREYYKYALCVYLQIWSSAAVPHTQRPYSATVFSCVRECVHVLANLIAANCSAICAGLAAPTRKVIHLLQTAICLRAGNTERLELWGGQLRLVFLSRDTPTVCNTRYAVLCKSKIFISCTHSSFCFGMCVCVCVWISIRCECFALYRRNGAIGLRYRNALGSNFILLL